MRVYLVQHGRAFSKDEDPERHLTDEGRLDVERMAEFLAKKGACVGAIRHSGKARARQTAEILGARIAATQGVAQHEGLGPKDPVGLIRAEIEAMEEDVLIVGHLPFLGKLAGEMVAGDASVEVVRFEPGAVVCLERAEQGKWTVKWMIVPELIRSAD